MTSMVGTDFKSETILNSAAGPTSKSKEAPLSVFNPVQKTKSQHLKSQLPNSSSTSKRSQSHSQEFRHKSSKYNRSSNGKDHYRRRKIEKDGEIIHKSSRETQREFPTTRIVSADGRHISPIRAFTSNSPVKSSVFIPIQQQGKQIANSDSDPEKGSSEDESSVDANSEDNLDGGGSCSEIENSQCDRNGKNKRYNPAAAVVAITMGGGDGTERYYVSQHGGGSSGGHHYSRSASASSRQARGIAGGGNSGSQGLGGSDATYHSPHVNASSSGSGRSRRSVPSEYYIDGNGGKTASPYHGATSNGGGNRRSSDRQHRDPDTANNYMLLRQAQRHQQAAALAQAAAAEYEHRMQHHSGSRSDLLEHDHNAIYEMSSSPHYSSVVSAQPTSVVPPPPGPNQYSFVRTCDGKFVRTAIPMHEFDALVDSVNAAAAVSGSTGTSGERNYYRSSANHTLRRPSKRHSQAVASSSDSYSCCPPPSRDELFSDGGGGIRSDKPSYNSYATLRGRKWTEKHGNRGDCGDNYGRNHGVHSSRGTHASITASTYLDNDSRSIASFTDDFMPSHHRGQHLQQINAMSSSIPMSRSILSRSTDRNLDNLGLDDQTDSWKSDHHGGHHPLPPPHIPHHNLLTINSAGIPIRGTNDVDVLSLLTREPPDGKEKPEPATGKSSIHKLEANSTGINTLSRKSSKCDLFSSTTNGSGSNGSTSGLGSSVNTVLGSTGSSLAHPPSVSADSCRSEATSLCGETSSVLSNSTMNGVKSDSNNANGGNLIPPIKRDSLSGAVIKDQLSTSMLSSSIQFANSSNNSDQLHGTRHQQLMPPPPGSGAAAVAAAAAAAAAQLASQQSQHHDDLDSGLSSTTSSKEWKSIQPNSPRNVGPGSSLVQSHLSNSSNTGLGVPQSSIISSMNNSVPGGPSAKTIVSSSGTISLQPSVILPAPPPPLSSIGGLGRGLSQLTPSSGPSLQNRSEPPNLNLRQLHSQPQTAVATYSNSSSNNPYISSNAQQQPQSSASPAPATTIASGRASIVTTVHETFHRIVFTSTAKFFGVHAETEESARAIWNERRRRLAIKRFGGVKDEYLSSQQHPYGAGGADCPAPAAAGSGNSNNMGGGTPSAVLGSGAYGTHHYASQGGYSTTSNPGRLGPRGMPGSVGSNTNGGYEVDYGGHLTSEMEGDKMVLKISKPPRNKDSLSSLTGQSFSWLVNSLMTRKVPSHSCLTEHEASRSYQPSSTGIAAYYQAEQSGGLAVCPPLPRVPSTHHLHGEGPAEEVFFTKPTGVGGITVSGLTVGPGSGCDSGDPALDTSGINSGGGTSRGGLSQRGTVPSYTSDPYRTCQQTPSWQLPRPDADLPRMSSDVGASRIWNRLLDAAFDNSDRRKHGMGFVGRMVAGRQRRATRRPPESNRKRKLGGNSGDHRPYFTYWITFVQMLVLSISMLTYGVGPIGIDLFKKTSMVLVTNLEVESVAHLEPANFWIGPSANHLIHLGGKYAPCMRWDEVLDREITAERLKERDTACCVHKDGAGCVQSPKTECSKIGDPVTNSVSGKSPKSKWWRPSEWYSKYPNDNRRSSGPVCGLDPAYCEAPASVAPYIWPDDITKWPICRRKTDIDKYLQKTSSGKITTGNKSGGKDGNHQISGPYHGHGHGHPGHHGIAEHMMCEIIGHPCCIGIRGQCKITTEEYCSFVGGSFHEEAALCSQVSCLNDVCGLLPFRDRDVPDQFYRTWTSLFLHAGIFHLALTILLQYWLMRDLEKMAGTVRIAIIYLCAGCVGNLASAIFVPYRAEVGPAGAHFGLLATCMVEVIHQWPTLKYPEMAILKLVGITAVFFLAGLLPWVDNYAHLFGFIFGFLLSYALLPFVTFGVYDRRRKTILVWICLASVVFLFVGLLLLFYVTPIHDCEVCKYFNCIPITKDFCADQNINLRADV